MARMRVSVHAFEIYAAISRRRVRPLMETHPDKSPLNVGANRMDEVNFMSER